MLHIGLSHRISNQITDFIYFEVLDFEILDAPDFDVPEIQYFEALGTRLLGNQGTKLLMTLVFELLNY